MLNILTEIEAAGIFPVVEVERLEDAVPIARALRQGGMSAMEITLRTPIALDAIRTVLDSYPDMLVGAGTVLSPEQVDQARAAGAQYIVTPGYNPRVVQHCLDRNILIIPGIDSPTGVELALEAGLSAVKFFPAEYSGGIQGLRAMAGPFKDRMKFLPLGGIGPHNLTDYACCDKVLAVGGTWLAKNDIIAAGDFDRITRNAREALALLHGFRLESVELSAGTETDADLFTLLSRAFPVGHDPLAMLSAVPGHADQTGQITIACNNLRRAAIWLESQALAFAFPEKGTPLVLESRPCGFTIQFIQRNG